MTHTWKFFRAGGFDQVKLESGADLANLDQLDQKLWVALACPTRGLEFDSRTLDLIDTDKDGRIRAPEVIAAAKWATGLLKNPDDLLNSSASLPLAAINDATPEGKQILSSAKQTLVNLGKPDAKAISIEDTMDTVKIFTATNFNGDGIIPADAASDDATKAVIADIMACLGVENDRSGKPGVSQPKVDQFFAEAQAHSDWWKQAEGDKNILPLGEATAAAFAAVKAVRAKVDDFFARCRVAGFDPRAVAALNRPESEYVALATKELTVNTAEIASLPLAQIADGKSLPLAGGVNPAWAGALAALQSAAVNPLLGERNSISGSDWAALNAKLAPFEAWSAGKVGATVEKIGIKHVREILAGDAKAKITALIAKDKALEPEANAISAVEKLARYHRDLHALCLNFVSFKNFYSRQIPAIFQAGRLYLDQRACDLCLTVEDAGKHSVMAALAGSYLAYCDCVRKSTGEKIQIVAAFTDGDSDNLMAGRNGIFYDRKGRDWDATVTKLIDNPISLRQAFWLPYKKLVRMIEEQVAKRAAAADTAATAKLQDAAAVTAGAAQPAQPKKIDLGTIALLTTAFTAIAGIATTILGYLGGMFSHGPINAIFAFAGIFICIILLISGPSMILAYIKLRKRNLAPILDANGWAVNAKAVINVPLGQSLTQVAELPPGSQRDLIDPFAAKKFPWASTISILIIAGILALGLGWYLGKLDKVLPAKATSLSVMGVNSVAFKSLGTNAPGWAALGPNAPGWVAPTNAIVVPPVVTPPAPVKP